MTCLQKYYPSLALCLFAIIISHKTLLYESLKIKMIKCLLYRRAKDSVVSVEELTFLTSYQGQPDKITLKISTNTWYLP